MSVLQSLASLAPGNSSTPRAQAGTSLPAGGTVQKGKLQQVQPALRPWGKGVGGEAIPDHLAPHQVKPTQNPQLTHRTVNKYGGGDFKLLRFKVVCHKARVNQYTQLCVSFLELCLYWQT